MELLSANSVTEINEHRSAASIRFPRQKLQKGVFILPVFLRDLEPKKPNSLELSAQSWFMGFMLLYFFVPFPFVFSLECY